MIQYQIFIYRKGGSRNGGGGGAGLGTDGSLRLAVFRVCIFLAVVLDASHRNRACGRRFRDIHQPVRRFCILLSPTLELGEFDSAAARDRSRSVCRDVGATSSAPSRTRPRKNTNHRTSSEKLPRITVASFHYDSVGLFWTRRRARRDYGTQGLCKTMVHVHVQAEYTHCFASRCTRSPARDCYLR